MGAGVIECGRWDHMGAGGGRMVVDPYWPKGWSWGHLALRGRQNTLTNSCQILANLPLP
jgi:hypothetical protein